jgi:hypothetical protein
MGLVQFQTPSTQATGMPLKSHTFHGGEDAVDEEVDDARWWEAEGALLQEREAMAKWFPTFIEAAGDHDSPPAWGGVIDTGKRKFTVLFMHRWDHGLPRVIPVEPKTLARSFGYRDRRDPPHIYTSGNLCVAAQEDWDHESDTMATVVAWAAHWLANYMEWTFTRKWPAEGYTDLAA